MASTAKIIFGLTATSVGLFITSRGGFSDISQPNDAQDNFTVFNKDEETVIEDNNVTSAAFLMYFGIMTFAVFLFCWLASTISSRLNKRFVFTFPPLHISINDSTVTLHPKHVDITNTDHVKLTFNDPPAESEITTTNTTTRTVTYRFTLPETWTAQQTESFILVDVPNYSEEFRRVERMFMEHPRSVDRDDARIVNIQRSQNTDLYHLYTLKKKRDKEQATMSNIPVADEKYLFHGSTNLAAYMEILRRGFDISFGTVSNLAGQGIYFAETSTGSEPYAAENAKSEKKNVIMQSYIRKDATWRT